MNRTKAESEAAVREAEKYDADSSFVRGCASFLNEHGYLTARQTEALKAVGFPTKTNKHYGPIQGRGR